MAKRKMTAKQLEYFGKGAAATGRRVPGPKGPSGPKKKAPRSAGKK